MIQYSLVDLTTTTRIPFTDRKLLFFLVFFPLAFRRFMSWFVELCVLTATVYNALLVTESIRYPCVRCSSGVISPVDMSDTPMFLPFCHFLLSRSRGVGLM